MSSRSGASASGRVGVRRSVRRSAAPDAGQNTVQAFEALIQFLLRASSRRGLSQLGSGDWAVSNALSKFHHLIFVFLPFHVYRIKRSYVGFFDGLYILILFFYFHPLILSHDLYYIAHFYISFGFIFCFMLVFWMRLYSVQQPPSWYSIWWREIGEGWGKGERWSTVVFLWFWYGFSYFLQTTITFFWMGFYFIFFYFLLPGTCVFFFFFFFSSLPLFLKCSTKLGIPMFCLTVKRIFGGKRKYVVYVCLPMNRCTTHDNC